MRLYETSDRGASCLMLIFFPLYPRRAIRVVLSMANLILVLTCLTTSQYLSFLFLAIRSVLCYVLALLLDKSYTNFPSKPEQYIINHLFKYNIYQQYISNIQYITFNHVWISLFLTIMNLKFKVYIC